MALIDPPIVASTVGITIRMENPDGSPRVSQYVPAGQNALAIQAALALTEEGPFLVKVYNVVVNNVLTTLSFRNGRQLS